MTPHMPSRQPRAIRRLRSLAVAAAFALAALVAGPVHSAAALVDSITIRFGDSVAPLTGEILPDALRDALGAALQNSVVPAGRTLDGAYRLVLAHPLPFDEAHAAINRVRMLPEVLYASLRMPPTPAGGMATKSALGGPQRQIDRMIVKYRDMAPIAAASANGLLGQGALDRLAVVTGQPVLHGRAISGGAWVVRFLQGLTSEQADLLAQMISAEPDVEYAEPDLPMYPLLVPTDPSYAGNQWDLKSAAQSAGGANLSPAWDITTGSSSINIAVLDTGILPHPDLANRYLAGYDMITDAGIANDGGGRDSDPSDPGDWETAGECGFGSPAYNSSWHGTHVAGTIAAATNNAIGIAGINWVGKVLPVRVLGKCGGYVSDIADAIRWAAGLSVAGVPANPTPARVINLSLGGSGACGATFQNAINAALNSGTVLAIAAGNSNDDAANFSPASCAGVIAVAATQAAGARASYSNFGTTVAIAAPGGGDGNYILSTLNSGTTTPVLTADGWIYANYQGTSMAAPHVAGIASLMLSVSPALTPAQVLATMQTTARAFPTGTVRDCTSNTNQVTSTVKFCGSGIIDAAAAVAAAAAASTGAPAVTTSAASSIAATGATLNGSVSSNGASTTVTFQYGLTTGYGSSATAAQSPLPAGATTTAVSAAIGGLACNTLYHYRAVAANSASTTNGADATFTTAACAPTATTSAATSIAATGATLNGSVSSNGASTTVTFQYGLTTGYGSSATAAQSPLPAGATTTAVSAAIGGLACNTLYHYRAVAANSASTTNGADATFTTAACAPTATTSAATSIAATGATLNGSVSSNGASTTVTFQYGLTTGYGSSATAAQSPLPASATTTAVSAAIGGLACNTLYHYRAVAANSASTTNGADATFTTAACAPTATTSAATSIAATGATLNGSVSSNGASTTVTFQYGLTTGYGSSATAAQSPLPAGATTTAVSAAIGGLACNTLYHYRAVAANSASTTNGADATFTTAACAPTATTSAATSIAATGATLNGSVSSNGASTTVTFQYGLTTGYGSSATAAQSPLPAGATTTAVSAAIGGLACNTLYHYRAVAANSASTTNGADATFTTAACAPTATTSAATSIAATGATLNGSVSSNGASTTVTFQYGLTTGYGSSATAAQSPLPAGATTTAVSAAIGGLACNTLYHYRAVAANSASTTNGADATFTTAACAPTATTSAATSIAATGATLNGSVSSNGASTTVTFQYGLTTGYGSSATAAQSPLPAGATTTAVSAAIGGLACNTLYHYRAVGANSASTTNGADATFTTAACAPTATTSAATSIAATGATLNGSVSSNGASTTVTFQYGLTTGYGSSATAAQSPLPAGATTTAVSAAIGGLACNTLYHYRAVGANSASTTNGADATFTTTACPLLSVTLGGGGTGTVTSSPAGISCGVDCVTSFANGQVALTATPAAGSIFIGWSGGACSGTRGCVWTPSAGASITATFLFVGSGSASANEWVQKSYVAYYGRPADPAGLAYWATRMDNEGGSLTSIIAAFGTSEEFNRRYGGLSNGEIIDNLYQQTLGRAPDPVGKQYYLDQLATGKSTLQTITLDLLGGATGADALTVAHRLDVANHFTGKVAQGCNYAGEQSGVASLTAVTADSTTVSAAKVTIENRCGF